MRLLGNKADPEAGGGLPATPLSGLATCARGPPGQRSCWGGESRLRRTGDSHPRESSGGEPGVLSTALPRERVPGPRHLRQAVWAAAGLSDPEMQESPRRGDLVCHTHELQRHEWNTPSPVLGPPRKVSRLSCPREAALGPWHPDKERQRGSSPTFSSLWSLLQASRCPCSRGTGGGGAALPEQGIREERIREDEGQGQQGGVALCGWV